MAFTFCSIRELLKYFELEKLCLLLNFINLIGHNFYSKKIIRCKHDCKFKNFKKILFLTFLSTSEHKKLILYIKHHKITQKNNKKMKEREEKLLNKKMSYMLMLFNLGCLKMIFVRRRLIML